MTSEDLETLIASGEGERDASRREHERTAKARHCEGDVCKNDA